MARNQSSDLRRNLYGNKIFKQNLNRKCARVPRFWGEFYNGSPYRLEILNKIFTIVSNYNLFPCLLCDPWIFLLEHNKKKGNRGLFCISLDLHYL